MRNREVIERLLAAFRADDRHTMRRLLAPHVQWVQNAGFPGGATHVGPDAVIDGAFARLRADWADWTATVREVLDAETAVVVLGEYRGTCRATGRSATAAFAHVYRVHADRVQRFEQYTDTWPLVAATLHPDTSETT
jgi:uncharacterized protein